MSRLVRQATLLLAAAGVIAIGWLVRAKPPRPGLANAIALPSASQEPLRSVTPVIVAAPDPEEELARLRGRVVVVFFWMEGSEHFLPGLDSMVSSARNIEIIGIPGAGAREKLERILRREGIGWRQFLDPQARWGKKLGSRSWPSIVLIGPDGRIAYSGYPGRGFRERLAAASGIDAPPPRRDRAAATVRGRLLFAGRPLPEVAPGQPNFWFRDEWRGTVPNLAVRYDERTGAFAILGAPQGTYFADVTLGHPRQELLTSFQGGGSFGVPASGRAGLEIEMQRFIHLAFPIDNGQELPEHGVLLRHPPPVCFSWTPIPEADRYLYHLEGKGPQGEKWETRGETLTASIEFDLRDGWEYSFDIDAWGPAGRVGTFELFGENWRGWDYRFIAGEALAERPIEPAEKEPLPAEREPLPAEQP